jgi:hypothetical protein
MYHSKAKVIYWAIVALGFFVTGCTTVYRVPKEPVALNAVDKIDMTIELCLTDQLCNARWEKDGFAGDTFVLPIGSALCMNAEAVARTVFTNVIIIKDQAASRNKAVDAVLIPSLAAIERDRPATIFSTQTTSILFSWTLNDPKDQPIWVTTIAGEGKGPMGRLYSEDAGYEQVEQSLGEVFQKSLREMTSSPLIREYAANLHK